MPQPAIGERRTFDGQLGEWNGQGWIAVTANTARREALTDDELQAVAASRDSSLMRKLTPEERTRLQSFADAPQYLDANGNPMTVRQAANAPKALDAHGNPIAERTWTDTAVDALPMLGGAAGGIVGGIGGTVGGFGVGGVPGAIGGAALLGGAGEAARQSINRWRGKPAPPTMTDAALEIGKEGATQGAMEGAGQAVMPFVNAGAQAVYRGYLKPSLSRVNLPKATQIVKDAIAEAIPVTRGGLQRADALISDLHGQVNDILSQATGKSVDLGQIANDVRAWATRMYDRPGRDPRDLKAAMAVADRIDGHPSVNPTSMGNQMAGKTTATVDLPTANQIKRDLQGSVRDKFGVPGGTAETAGEKYASAATRQAIEVQAPEVGPLNARQSRLISVARAVNQAVGRESNRNQFFGVPSIMAGMAGGGEYARSGDPASAAAAALAARFALHPAVATKAAILASQIAQRIPGAAVSDVARVAVQVAAETNQQEEVTQ